LRTRSARRSQRRGRGRGDRRGLVVQARRVKRSRRVKRRWYALVALVAIACLVGGGLIYAHNRTGSIYHLGARFVPETNPKPPAPTKHEAERFACPIYGYTKNHTRYFPAPASLRPPFKEQWARGGTSLREFPPVLSENRIF